MIMMHRVSLFAMLVATAGAGGACAQQQIPSKAEAVYQVVEAFPNLTFRRPTDLQSDAWRTTAVTAKRVYRREPARRPRALLGEGQARRRQAGCNGGHGLLRESSDDHYPRAPARRQGRRVIVCNALGPPR